MEVVNTVGRRKAAVARVYVKPGKGQITINRKALEVYFPLEILQYQVKQPLLATNTAENYDIVINLDGGGITGQASAARLGIARALCEIDAEMRPVLKKAGFLTRDPREVERKKPGPIYPCVIHSTPEHFGPKRSQAIIGIQMACAYVGSCIMPPIFGLVAAHISLALLPVYLFGVLALMVVMHEKLVRKLSHK